MSGNLHPTIAQAIAAFAPPQSEVHREPVNINDDDLYIFNAETHECLQQHGPRYRPDLVYAINASNGLAMLHDGTMVARGMRVRFLGLWRARVAADAIPAFIREGATA